MQLRTCSHCGTEYNPRLSRCPHCGRGKTVAARTQKKAARAASTKEDPDRIPRWLWALISCVLGLAVLIGLIAFVLQMGYFEEGFDLNAIPTNLEQTQPPQEAEIYPDNDPEPEQTEDKSCTDLTISKDEIVLSSLTAKNFLTAVASPSDCEDEIVFSSTDESVVLVSEKGMLTAVAPGVAEITVTCGDVTRTCTVICDFELPEQTEEEDGTQAEDEEETEDAEDTEITEVVLPDPEVVPADFTLRTPGEEAYLTVKNVPEGAVVTFASADPSIVSVTSDGKVRAQSDGQTNIIITVGSVQLKSIARCNLSSTTEGGDTTENTAAATGPVEISHSDVTFSFAGESFTISLINSEGKAVSGVTWTTANAGVCTVSGSTVKAAGSGQTKVSTVYNGVTYSCIIRCNF